MVVTSTYCSKIVPGSFTIQQLVHPHDIIYIFLYFTVYISIAGCLPVERPIYTES